MGISVEPIFDKENIKSFVLQDSLWQRISFDYINKDKYEPDMDDLWLEVKMDGKRIGLCTFPLINSVTVELHPYFPKETKHHGRNGVIECLRWLKAQTSRRIEKVVTTIPSCFRSNYNGAKKVGFTDEGFSPASYMKDGVLHDRAYLGLSLNGWSY